MICWNSLFPFPEEKYYSRKKNIPWVNILFLFENKLELSLTKVTSNNLSQIIYCHYGKQDVKDKSSKYYSHRRSWNTKLDVGRVELVLGLHVKLVFQHPAHSYQNHYCLIFHLRYLILLFLSPPRSLRPVLIQLKLLFQPLYFKVWNLKISYFSIIYIF